MRQSEKVLTKKLKRLYQNKIADARDYEVEKCRQLGMGIRFEVEGVGSQTFTPEEGFSMNKKLIESKRGTKPYRLISFFWKTQTNNGQQVLAL